jgi:uncharacterized membrane protein YqiK
MTSLLLGAPLVAGFGTLIALIVFYLLMGIRYIPNSKVGLIEKRMSPTGSLASGLVALHGEAGFQPDLLRGGLHYLLPIFYRVHKLPLVTIAQGRIGYIFARDGKALPPSQTLAMNVETDDFEDAAAFLRRGGQKGPQRKILREGTYAINLVQFCVITQERLYYLPLDGTETPVLSRMAQLIEGRAGFSPVVIEGSHDMLGVVTVHDGPSLAESQIIAPSVGDDPLDSLTYHNSFQNPEHFLRAGGRRGRQLQTLVEGTYNLNRLFATVEMVPKTVVDVGTVGVVVSYVGETGEDLSGEAYKHGELVRKHSRGVWSEPLMPGKYAFNTYAGKVITVPTTNFILKWNQTETGVHRFDENLSEISLITKDAFEPSLPLSVVVHIDYRKAPFVIQRFGDVKRLVEQTLDPMVSAYFKNVGQTRTLIQLLQDRSVIQQISSEQMREKFTEYNLELEEVLIGTPRSPEGNHQIEEILTQLRSRQIAEEQVATYALKEKAAVKERELREAESRAKQQTSITESELSICVQENHGKAELARSHQQAAQIETLARAESEKIRILGEGEAKKIQSLATAEAERTARVGIAQAMAIEEQVRAYGGPQLQLTKEVLTRFAQAIETAKIDVVPKIVLGGGSGSATGPGGSGNVLEALMSLLLSEKIGQDLGLPEAAARRPETEAIRREVSEALA